MPDDALPWFPCYPAKLLGAIAGMKPDEAYVYLIMVMRIYEKGGPCNDRLDAIARRTGINKRRVSDALDKLFHDGKLQRVGDGIMNPFAGEIIAEAIALHETRVRAGQLGGTRSAEKRQRIQQPDASSAQADQPPGSTHLHLQKQESLGFGKQAELTDPVWNRVRSRMRGMIGEQLFASWIANVGFESLGVDGTVHLVAPTRFVQSWLNAHFIDKLLTCWQFECASLQRVCIGVVASKAVA